MYQSPKMYSRVHGFSVIGFERLSFLFFWRIPDPPPALVIEILTPVLAAYLQTGISFATVIRACSRSRPVPPSPQTRTVRAHVTKRDSVRRIFSSTANPNDTGYRNTVNFNVGSFVVRIVRLFFRPLRNNSIYTNNASSDDVYAKSYTTRAPGYGFVRFSACPPPPHTRYRKRVWWLAGRRLGIPDCRIPARSRCDVAAPESEFRPFAFLRNSGERVSRARPFRILRFPRRHVRDNVITPRR